PREATDEEIAAWRDRVSSEIGSDDLWIVGGSRLSRLPATAGAARLQIRECMKPECSSLTAEVIEKGRAKSAVQMELPEESLCIRLLRDTFFVRGGAVLRSWSPLAAPASHPLLTMCGASIP